MLQFYVEFHIEFSEILQSIYKELIFSYTKHRWTQRSVKDSLQ